MSGQLNGTYRMVSEQGSVLVSERIKLKIVLFVLKLNCKLVSVSKLCKQLNCAVTLFDDSFVIQDHTSRIHIGAGEHRDRVYYLQKLIFEQANAMDTGSLWDKRLGHSSSDTLTLLPNSLGVKSDSRKNKCDAFDVYLYAK